MRLPDGREVPDPGLFGTLFILFICYWMLTSVVWGWRNPTANPMTTLRYIVNVLSWDKLEEFQVPSSR